MSPAKRAVRRKSLADEPVPYVRHAATTHTISRAYGRAVAGFTLVAVVLAGVILMVTGSKATVTVVPKVSRSSVDFSISVVASSTGSDSIPGRLLELATSTTATVEVAPASPTAPDPNAKAGGTVTIANRSSSPQALVATTRLLAKDGSLFRLQHAVTVPANGQVPAAVLADQPGARFAIGPSTFSIPGLNPTRQTQVTASSDQPFTLAAAAAPAGLTADQIAAAKARALASLGPKLSDSLGGLLFSTEQLTPESVTTTPLDFATAAKVGDVASTITFSGTVRVSAILFNQRTMREMAAAAAAKEHPGAQVDESSLAYSVQRSSGGGTLGTINGHVSAGTTGVELEASDLTGRSKKDAEVYVQLLPGVEQVGIKISPAWFSHLPQDPSRITVVIQKP